MSFNFKAAAYLLEIPQDVEGLFLFGCINGVLGQLKPINVFIVFE
jgi:hypothetical protein